MAFKFKVSKNRSGINLPTFPQLQSNLEPEVLTGEVRGLQASAPEERLARALDKANIQYMFRYVVGAPKGLPGWKEVDFIVTHRGLVYPVEVDTAFTHRAKEYSDVLHDAIIMNDSNLAEVGTLWPSVFHFDGDSDLANNANAESLVSREFGRG